MDAQKVHRLDHVANGDQGLSPPSDENPEFDYINIANSQSLCDVVKCCLIKFLVDGTDMVLKDARSRKINPLGNGLMNSSEISSDTYQLGNGECSFRDTQQREVNCKDAWNNEYVNVSHVVKPSLGGYTRFLFNLLAFLAVFMMKLIGFQFNLLVSFFTFPFWFSYFAFMSFLFPLHALKQVRGYLRRKLFRMWDDTSKTVKLKAKKSVGSLAKKLSCALFWSSYVCFMLVGLLVSGFLFGGFMMRCLLEKPIHTTETLNFDYTKPSPVAFVPLTPSPVVGRFSNPEDDMRSGKVIGPRVIPYNHRLQLTVSLTVPESDYNRKLGVFQVKVEFLSANGKVTASSRLPCMLRFKSQTLRFAQNIIKSIPLLTGHQSESQVLNIKMNEFTEGVEPTAWLKVSIEQRAEFQPGAGIPEIYAASIALESELPQSKRMIWYWRRTIFVCTSLMWFLMELMAILVFYRPMIIPRGRPGNIACADKVSKSNFIAWYKSKSS